MEMHGFMMTHSSVDAMMQFLVPLWDFGMIEALYCNSWYFDVKVTGAEFGRSTSLRSRFFTAILHWYEQYA